MCARTGRHGHGAGPDLPGFFGPVVTRKNGSHHESKTTISSSRATAVQTRDDGSGFSRTAPPIARHAEWPLDRAEVRGEYVLHRLGRLAVAPHAGEVELVEQRELRATSSSRLSEATTKPGVVAKSIASSFSL
jgi:hypothetical protein